MTGPDVTAAVSGTTSPEAGDPQTRLLTSKVDADHSHLTMRPRAWIDSANPPRTRPPLATAPPSSCDHCAATNERGGVFQRAPSTQPRPGSRRLYQRLAAGSLIVAPLVLLAGELLHPELHLDPARQLAVAAANPDRWYLAHLLSLIGFALLVPAILGLTRLVGQGRAALADLGGTLALLGVLAASGLLSIDGFWGLADGPAGRRPAAR
jgi:hypothetical protein